MGNPSWPQWAFVLMLAFCMQGVVQALPLGVPKHSPESPQPAKPGSKALAEEEGGAQSGRSGTPRKTGAPPQVVLEGPISGSRAREETLAKALKDAKDDDTRSVEQQQPQTSRSSREAEYLQREASLARQWGLRVGSDQRYQLSSNSRAAALLMQMRARDALQQATRTTRLQVFRNHDNRFERLASWAPARWPADPHLVLVADSGSRSPAGSTPPTGPNEKLFAAAQAAVEDLVATAFREVVLKAQASPPETRGEDLSEATGRRLRECRSIERLQSLQARPVSEATAQGDVALRHVTAVQVIPGDDDALLVRLWSRDGGSGMALAVRMPLKRVLDHLVTARL